MSAEDDSADEATILRADASRSASASLRGTGDAEPQATDASPSAASGQILKSRFVLEERIGSGGMGSVFRAKDLRKVEARDTRPFIAVKVLNNDFRRHPQAFIALQREATKSQALRHSNIVSIFDFDKDGDVPFMTMELLDGQELAALLRAHPTGLPEEMAWPIIADMVQGLMHAHNEGVVHADFKPGNVYVTRDRGTKILDFGIARAIRLNRSEETDYDPARLAALTPAYASREMLNGDNAEPRDDLFSLGVVIYMMLTGVHPYGRVPANEAVKEGLRPQRIPGLSRRRWRSIEKCLSFNRQDRPTRAEEVHEALFGRTPWRTLTAAAAALVLGVSLLVTLAQDNAEMLEVKNEVRTETLVQAQVERIDQLLQAPAFDGEWTQTLFSEVQTLRTVAPLSSANLAIAERIAATYTAAIQSSDTLDQAFHLFRGAGQFNAGEAAAVVLVARLQAVLGGLLVQPLDAGWLASAEQVISYAQRFFPREADLNATRATLMAYLLSEITRAAREGGEVNLAVAEQAWNTFEHQIADAGRRDELHAFLQSALSAAAERKADAQAAQARRRLRDDLERRLAAGCLQLDVPALARTLRVMEDRHPSLLEASRARVAQRVTLCTQRLGALDPEQAAGLRASAATELGLALQLVQGETR